MVYWGSFGIVRPVHFEHRGVAVPCAIPIYRDHDETYRADSCQPLRQAAAGGGVRLEALRHGHYPGGALPAAALPGIKMIGFWDAAEDQPWGLDWHRNEGVEITFLERGALAYGADGKHYLLQPDDLTIARPWQLHRVGDPRVTASRLHWLIIDIGVRRPHQPWKWPPWLLLARPDLDELTKTLRHNEQPVWRANPDLRRSFREIARTIEAKSDEHAISRLTLRVNDLFLSLLEMFRIKRVRLDTSLTTSRRTVQLFLADLRANPEHLSERWTLAGMADSCGLGRTQFVHHVRSLTNMSPLQFLTHCRLEASVEALCDRPRRPITEIALACGFSSSQYFATVFAAHFGCGPREFRYGQAVNPRR